MQKTHILIPEQDVYFVRLALIIGCTSDAQIAGGFEM